MNYFTETSEKCRIAAHRGNRSLRPENTRSAFEMALGGCDFIECDVQMSRDGVPVIHHDPRLGRTSNAEEVSPRAGIESLTLCDWDLAQLRGLDMGGWFLRRDPFGTIASGTVEVKDLQREIPQRVLTLRELLDWARDRAMPLNIELKDQECGPQEHQIVSAVLQEIRKSGFVRKILVSSFRHDYLRKIKKEMPELPVGVLQEEHHPGQLLDYLKGLGAEAYHPEAELVDSELITLLRPEGIGVHVFTVNEPDEVSRLSGLGVSAVFTDFPHKFF